MANNKIIIIDKTTVITGSFNFTTAAEQSNAENLLVIKSKELAKIYLVNWDKHKEHSKTIRGNRLHLPRRSLETAHSDGKVYHE